MLNCLGFFFFLLWNPASNFLFPLNKRLILIMLRQFIVLAQDFSLNGEQCVKVHSCLLKVLVWLLGFCRIMRIRSGSLLGPNCG